MANFEMWHLYTHLLEYIRQDKKTTNRIVQMGPITSKEVSHQGDQISWSHYQFPIKMFAFKNHSSLYSYWSQLQQANREISYKNSRWQQYIDVHWR
jgi:hypothetical protein